MAFEAYTYALVMQLITALKDKLYREQTNILAQYNLLSAFFGITESNSAFQADR